LFSTRCDGDWAVQIGAVYADKKCEFTVWAPYLIDLKLKLPDTGAILPMQKANEGYWKVTTEVTSGATYTYLINGQTERPDPASHFQPQGVTGPSAVVDHAIYQWRDASWRGINLKDVIFYELHVGTFTEEGTFQAATKRIKELAELGVNAVQLMPVAQFPGKRNWGYDVALPYAVQNSYGSPDDFKRLVDECHRNGLAVFLDVVYHHAGFESNFLNEFGPYFVPNLTTGRAPLLNLNGEDSLPIRNYFLENTLHWLRDYHLDGIRLNSALSMSDLNLPSFLSELTQTVHALAANQNRKLWIISESEFNEPKVLAALGEGGFGFDGQILKDFQHSILALITAEKEGDCKNYGCIQDVIDAITEAYTYVGSSANLHKRTDNENFSCVPSEKFIASTQDHDEVGNRLLGERVTALAGLDAAKLAAGLTLLSPYVPLLFMGEEYAETAPFHLQSEASDPNSKSTFEASKLNWKLRTERKNSKMLAYYKTLIMLRRKMSAPCYSDRYDIQIVTTVDGKVLFTNRCPKENSVVLIANFNRKVEATKFPFDGGSYIKAIDSADIAWGGDGYTLPQKLHYGDIIHLTRFNFAIYVRQKRAT
jgi:maltooligosyltrehalose trehalohydrolase